MNNGLGRVPRYQQYERLPSDQQLGMSSYDADSHMLAGDIADYDQYNAIGGLDDQRRDSEAFLCELLQHASTDDPCVDGHVVKPVSRPSGSSETPMKRLSAAPAWEHKLSEKHLHQAPSPSQTVRYFDRGRQTRRVLIDCLWMWSGTALICAGLAILLWYYQSIQNGATRWQKYTFNTVSNGLLLLLGIAFAAQFKQYCEMMRWRFLASSYWTLDELDEVLGCDSWRSAIRLIARKRRKGWLPGKSQVVAAVWVLTFVVFNVVSAALGLTYALEDAETGAHLSWG